MAKEKYYGFSDSKSKAEVPTKEDIATEEVDSDEKIYSAKYFNKTIGKLSELKTSIKTSIVAAINKVWDTLEERTGKELRLYVNKEGGAIEFTEKGTDRKWRMNLLNGVFRLYAERPGDKYCVYSFPTTEAGGKGGTVGTVEQIDKKMDKMTVVNNVTTTEAGTVLDGRVGERLNGSVVKAQSTANTANSTANNINNNLSRATKTLGSAYGVTATYRSNVYLTTVYWNGTHVGDKMAAYTQRNMGTLPAGHRPNAKCQIPVAGVPNLYLTIEPSGVVSMRNEHYAEISFAKVSVYGALTFIN